MTSLAKNHSMQVSIIFACIISAASAFCSTAASNEVETTSAAFMGEFDSLAKCGEVLDSKVVLSKEVMGESTRTNFGFRFPGESNALMLYMTEIKEPLVVLDGDIMINQPKESLPELDEETKRLLASITPVELTNQDTISLNYKNTPLDFAVSDMALQLNVQIHSDAETVPPVWIETISPISRSDITHVLAAILRATRFRLQKHSNGEIHLYLSNAERWYRDLQSAWVTVQTGTNDWERHMERPVIYWQKDPPTVIQK